MPTFDPAAAMAAAEAELAKRVTETAGAAILRIAQGADKAIKEGDFGPLNAALSPPAPTKKADDKPPTKKADAKPPTKKADATPRTRRTTATPKKGAPKKSGLATTLRARRGK